MNFAQGLEIMANLIFVTYLAWVSWQDNKELQVVRYSHLLGVFAVPLQVILQKTRIVNSLNEYFIAILVLLVLQGIAYRFKLYGFADVIVFFLCGTFLLLEKGTEKYLLAYFLVQAVSGSLLLLVQLAKGNVKGLNLKRPAPYIPYICFAFILTNMVL